MLSVIGYTAGNVRGITLTDINMSKARILEASTKEAFRSLVRGQSPRGVTDTSNFDNASFSVNPTYGARIMLDNPAWVWKNCPIPKSLTFIGYGNNGTSGQYFNASLGVIDPQGNKFPLILAKRTCYNFTMPTGNDGVFINNGKKRVAGWDVSSSGAATRFPVNYTIADVATACPDCFKPGQTTCDIGWWYPSTSYSFFITEIKIKF